MIFIKFTLILLYTFFIFCHVYSLGSVEAQFHALWGFPVGSEVKASASNAGDPGSIPGSGRSPGEGNGNPLQHSCLENPMDRGAWRETVHGVAEELDTTEAT